MRMETVKPGLLLAGLLAASVCLVLPTRSADAGTIMVRVNAANHDAEEDLNDNSSDLELGNEDGVIPQLVGMRFANISIPQGARRFSPLSTQATGTAGRLT